MENSPPKNMNPHHVSACQNHMATTFSFVLSCDGGRVSAAKQTLDEAHRLVAQLENELSEYRELSPIYQLNHSPVFQKVPLTTAGIDLLRVSEQLGTLTGRAFSVTAKSRGNQGRVSWNSSGLAWREHPNTHVGFGAIGKGYALDKVRELVEQAGFTDYLLDAGGSSKILSGFSSPGQPWKWGWSLSPKGQDPMGFAFTHHSGKGVAIGVSGTQEQGEHLLDPRGVRRSGNHPRSALIASPSATEADALSTALFVSGWETTFERIKNMPHLPAMALVDEQNIPRWNGVFQNLWGAILSIMLFVLTLPVYGNTEETVDLSDLGADDFTPYIVERNQWWMLLPIFALAVIALHLKDSRPRPQLQPRPSEEP